MPAAAQVPATPAPAVPARPDGPPRLVARLGAEALGTFVLVFAGCGSAIFAAAVVNGSRVPVGIGFAGVSLAFGLTVLTMAIAVGRISGGHFNPAVTVGLAVAGRVDWRLVPAYIVTQLVASVVAGAALLGIAAGKRGFDATESGFATNGFGSRSPDGYNGVAAFVVEVILTAIFLAIIIASTGPDAPKNLAPFSIGLGLTLTNLVAIPIDNASINPARSLGVAVFAGTGALGQLWLFLVAPTVGAAIAGLIFRGLTGRLGALGGQGDAEGRV